jgi:SAM-dependent methyltransferase
MDRREALGQIGVAGASAVAGLSSAGGLLRAEEQASLPTKPVAPKPVAAIVTIYNKGSHSDVILGRILEGWKQDGGPGPALKLVSLYVDQFPADDIARAMAKKHSVPIFDTIDGAVGVGTNGLPVDGVLCIGEHGDYPWNDLGQHLYPRRRFLTEIAAALEKRGRVVPVFHDKHLGPAWDDAKWMYERAKELRIPIMAGSSLPVGYRKPDLEIPLGADIEAAVGIGYDGRDVYGFHALECLQCVVERRLGGETGVAWVEALEGEQVWKIVDADPKLAALFAAALEGVPHVPVDRMRKDEGIALIRIGYRDGFTGHQFLMNVSASLTGVAVKLRGEDQPRVCHFEERPHERYPHFAWLTKAIERMVHTGRSPYPVERTYLTGGILDRALRSLADEGRRRDTPELAIAYAPVAYPHAPVPDLASSPTAPLP